MPKNAQRQSAVSCTRMAEVIEMLFGLRACVGQRKHA